MRAPPHKSGLHKLLQDHKRRGKHSILLMTVFMAIDGQALVMPMIVVFVGALAISATLAWAALRTRRRFMIGRMAIPQSGILALGTTSHS